MKKFSKKLEEQIVYLNNFINQEEKNEPLIKLFFKKEDEEDIKFVKI